MKQQEVPFCCYCGKVRDELGTEVEESPWTDLRAYMMKYGFKHKDLKLTYTYCPKCLSLYKMLMGVRKTTTTMPQEGLPSDCPEMR